MKRRLLLLSMLLALALALTACASKPAAPTAADRDNPRQQVPHILIFAQNCANPPCISQGNVF